MKEHNFAAARNEMKKAPALLLVLFLAPLKVELLNLWGDFRKVVQFIDENEKWLKSMLSIIQTLNRG